MNDPLRLPVLRALDAAGDHAPTADELIDFLQPLETMPVVVVTAPLVEHTLFQLEREELVEQVDAMAEYHAPTRPAPMGERRWALLDAGRAVLSQGDAE